MLHRTAARTLIGAAALTLSVAVIPAAGAATGSPGSAGAVTGSTGAPRGTVPRATITLYYDDSQAAEFKSAVVAGAESWNSNVQNVHLVEAAPGQQADIDVVAYDGWPESTLGPVYPGGHGTVYYGREAVNEGYDTVRIAAHELGHSLGLPDNKPGPCSSLMSGSTGGVDCKNATPDAEEVAGVEANYASGVARARHAFSGRILIDAP